jgi:sugar phosphate permease
MNQSAITTEAPGGPRYRALVLAMLLIVYTLNYVDRQILGILAMNIKADLQLSDLQLGLLGGLAFSLLYSTLAVPFAIVADRTSRTWVITIGLALWSFCTGLCGVATSFGALLLARAGVSIGEAGGVAPSHALISSYFPPGKRGFAIAVFLVAVPGGSALAAFFGGYVAATIDWRTAFIALGVLGVVIAPIFRLIVREPPQPVMAREPLKHSLAALLAKRSFWLISLGAAANTMIVTGSSFWLPSLLQRSFGFGPAGAGQYFGALMIVAGVPGVLFGGWLSDKLGRADKGAYVHVPAICSFIAAPLFACAVMMKTPGLAFLLFLVPTALSYAWLSPLTTAVQHLAPANERASASAVFMLTMNLIGLGGGALLLGALSDAMMERFGGESLRYALLAASLLYLVAGLLLWSAIRALRRDWVE